MRKAKNIISFLLIIEKLFSQSWQQLPSFPAAGRDDGSVFTIGNNVYCGLGSAFGIGPSSDFYRFNPLNDTWSSYTVTSLPAIGRQYSCSFSYTNYGYIVGGVDANWKASNMVWRYDTITNNWTQKTSIPDSVQGAVCFFINNKAYICGGRDKNNKCSKKVWEYNVVNDTWLQKNNMPNGGRWRASGTVINNKGYLVFGADSLNKFSKKLFEYNPIGDIWLLIDSFPNKGRTYASAFNVNNQLVIALGIDSGNVVYNDCYNFNIGTRQWTTLNSLPSFGRKGCMAFSFINTIYITTGIDQVNNRLTETWKSININGVKEINTTSFKIEAYPNPFNNELTVKYTFTEANPSNTISLIEIGTGRVLEQKTCTTQNGSILFNTETLSNGLYFISVHEKNKPTTFIKVVNIK